MPGHAQRGEAAEALRRILTCPEHSPCSQAAERLTLPGLPSWLLRRPYWADSPASQRYTKDVKGCGRIVSPGVKSPAKRGFRGTPRASPRLRRPIRHDKTFWGLWCPKASPKQMKTPSECWSGLGVRTGAGAGKTRIQIVFVIRNLPGSLPAKPSIWDANLNSDHSAPGCNNQDQEAQCSPPSSAMTGCLRAGHSLPTR